MTIFSCNNLSKSFNDKLLFDGVAFGMEAGERIGIIGKNGAGKTTLMKMIAGLEDKDSGEVIFNNDVKLEYLDQLPAFDHHDTVLNAVLKSNAEIHQLFEDYHALCAVPKENISDDQAKQLERITHRIDELGAWNYENEAKKMLSQLGIDRLYDDVMDLSGGLRKRVALARALLSNPDMLILDEPTNHLDADSVQWLQDRLQNSSGGIMFVTHDRYFLDAIATKIVEIDEQKIISYPGNYESYLERKENAMRMRESEMIHKLSRLRTELAWLQKGAKARRSKQKSRIDWIDELKKSAVRVKQKDIKIELGTSFLGSRIIDAHDITRTIGKQVLFNKFTYIAKPKDRIGIIGPNGSGKSTLLRTLAGQVPVDSGRVELGGSSNIGFFRQELEDLNLNHSLHGALKEVAEYIDVGEGRDRYLTTRDLLDKFLFPRNQQSNLVSSLSGGERRRLGLLRVLMANPNVLLLDEPTNDFDIQTLAAFEEYLDDFYGVLLIVSHDRAFLDRTVNFIWAFDGHGNIKEYPGNYTYYLEKKEQEERLRSRSEDKTAAVRAQDDKPKVKKKLSFNEQREFDTLEKRIPELEVEKEKIETLLGSGTITDYKELEEHSTKLQNINEEIERSTEKWFELMESLNS